MLTPAPPLVQVGLDHRGASLGMLERVHARRSESASRSELPPGVGLVELATCHRVELYLEGVAPVEAPGLFARWVLGDPPEADLREALVLREGPEAARHLLHVAAGLESAVPGEDQILAQSRRAYREACRARRAGPLLHRAFHAAFRAGKRVRSETALADGARSLAGLAVSELGRLLGGLRGRSVLVLGLGETGSLAATRLRDRGVGRLVLANRTLSTTAKLAARLGAEALPWPWRSRALMEADGVVCACRATEPVVPAAWLRDAAARGRPLGVVDLGVPRNVELPASPRSEVHLIDLDRLTRCMDETAGRREGARLAAAGIVEQELATWLTWARARVARDLKEREARRGAFPAS